jgi:heme-degrading monooxygenase HmoA
MISRLWRGRAPKESAHVYLSHVVTTVFPKLQQLEGYIGGRVLRRTVDHQIEFLVITEWTSWAAIRAFAGDAPDQAVVEPAALAVLTSFETHVEHFELAHHTY